MQWFDSEVSDDVVGSWRMIAVKKNLKHDEWMNDAVLIFFWFFIHGFVVAEFLFGEKK